MILRVRIVKALEAWCNRLHFVFHHRPWLWLPLPACPLAHLSSVLDERWRTGVWDDGMNFGPWDDGMDEHEQLRALVLEKSALRIENANLLTDLQRLGGVKEQWILAERENTDLRIEIARLEAERDAESQALADLASAHNTEVARLRAALSSIDPDIERMT